MAATTSPSKAGSVTVTTEPWGTINDQEIKKFTLKNSAGQEVDVITYGATVTAIRTPDKEGHVADVVLGFDDIKGYRAENNPYFGATIGRVANRIGKATFIIDGQRYHVSKNKGRNSLHGGTRGWSWKVWNATVEGDCVVMTLVSPDGDEGYPGTVTTTVTFQLNDNGELRIEMRATTTKATPINMTNHGYFNLAGLSATRIGHDDADTSLYDIRDFMNAEELYKHVFIVNADRWTVTDAESIPTGELRCVEDSVMDLRNATVLGEVIDEVPGGGYDYNFCLPGPYNPKRMSFVAKVVHPASGRRLDVYSNQPGVQLYTSNFLPEKDQVGITGKKGTQYYRHAAFCLETQNYPDAINHENFPNSLIRPGDVYKHVVIYKFGVEA
ncbi:hypothetical protein DMN91_010653 [Ooceraea biroi]|nr:hypothetical protein DMN91_010653 [Ooceraea biroi]